MALLSSSSVSQSIARPSSISHSTICPLPSINTSHKRQRHPITSFTAPPTINALLIQLSNIPAIALRPLSDGLNFPEHMGIGLLATSIAVSAMHPLDSIKTQLQSGAKGFGGAIRALVQGKGPFGLYKGLGFSILGQGPAGAVKFAVFESLIQHRQKWPWLKNLGDFGEFVCGAVAFTCCSVFLVPGEVFKVRSQAGVSNNVLALWRQDGLGGFYRGYRATMIRDIPYTMLEFGLYRTFKKVLANVVDRKLTSKEEFLMGGLAGGCTGFLTTPLDVVRTNIMAGAQAGGKVKVSKLLKQVARQEGLGGLFKGSTARVAWLIPFTAIFFGVHEASKRALRRRKPTGIRAENKLTSF